jgi:hypothetical protein
MADLARLLQGSAHGHSPAQTTLKHICNNDLRPLGRETVPGGASCGDNGTSARHLWQPTVAKVTLPARPEARAEEALRAICDLTFGVPCGPKKLRTVPPGERLLCNGLHFVWLPWYAA